MYRRGALITAVMAVFLAFVSFPAFASPTMMKTANGIQYVNGGVGIEERASLHSDFPLKLIFAEGKPYISDVNVTIMNSSGKAVFETLANNGPWLFVNLPPGSYRVEATFKGVTRDTSVRIPSRSARTNITLDWPSRLG